MNLSIPMLAFRRYSTVSIKFSTKDSQMQFCLERGKSIQGDNSFLFSPITYNLWNDPPPYIFDLHTKLLMPRGAILGKARVFLHEKEKWTDNNNIIQVYCLYGI
jgi:hypothetical protein